jgi:hypothetical protein
MFAIFCQPVEIDSDHKGIYLNKPFITNKTKFAFAWKKFYLLFFCRKYLKSSRILISTINLSSTCICIWFRSRFFLEFFRQKKHVVLIETIFVSHFPTRFKNPDQESNADRDFTHPNRPTQSVFHFGLLHNLHTYLTRKTRKCWSKPLDIESKKSVRHKTVM